MDKRQGISTVADVIVYGSTQFTNYDGVGCTLLPIAGKVLGAVCVSGPSVIKIIERPVSQLAPPFVHLDLQDMNNDGHDELVFAADNDVLGGLNKGAIYMLDGKKIKEEWGHRDSFAEGVSD